MKLSVFEGVLSLGIDILDKSQGFLVLVDQGQAVEVRTRGQKLLVLTLGDVGAVAATAYVPVSAVEKQPDWSRLISFQFGQIKS